MAKVKSRSEPLTEEELKEIKIRAQFGENRTSILKDFNLTLRQIYLDKWKPFREAFEYGHKARKEVRLGSLEMILLDINQRIKQSRRDPRIRVERWEILLVEREANRERLREEEKEYRKRRYKIMELQAELLKKQLEGPPAPEGVMIGTCTEDDYRRYWEDNGIDQQEC